MKHKKQKKDLQSKATFKHTDAIETLKQNHLFPDGPCDRQTSWYDFERTTEILCGNYNPKQVKFDLLQAGLIDEYGKWDKDLIKFGLVQEISYFEVDPCYGFTEKLTQTLINTDRGLPFFQAFYKLIQS